MRNVKTWYKGTYLQNINSHRSRKQHYGYQGGKEGGINWEVGTDIYTLLYIKQITKNILDSTGNSTQYSNDLYGKRI